MFPVIFAMYILLSLTVQQAASSLTMAASLEIQRVMEERISKLLPLFSMKSPDTTTAVVFGNHFRYFCDLSKRFAFIFYNPLPQVSSEFAIIET